MKQTKHTSLTALFRTIREEKLEQFAVFFTKDELTGVDGYNLSRPYPFVKADKEELAQ
jgi:hypothetical protein